MLTVEEALARILAAARVTDVEVVPLERALGRVLNTPSVVAAHDVPPFSNSAMDGFAVRASDLPGVLRVVGESAAGAAAPPPVTFGQAVRIMTGAPIPVGADAVVPIEHAAESNGTVQIDGEAERGAFVRLAGHDTPAGTAVAVGGRLTPAGIAVLASLGIARVAVRRRPRVAILSTGDELRPAGERLEPGQIHDANSPALAAAVEDAGGEPVGLPAAGDDPQVIGDRVREAVASADLLVASGGVSVGRHDHVRGAFERLGSLDFWRIRVQPGKPLAFGVVGERPVIGLPGNPVSALVTFELFVRPLIRAMLGLRGSGRVHVRATVEEQIGKDQPRRAYLRARVMSSENGYVALPAGGQMSSQLRPLADANALLVVPEGEAAAEPGRTYEAIVIGELE